MFYEPMHDALAILGYVGTFLAGLLYPYSFTTTTGTAILLIISKEQNLLLAGIIASIGALISDMAIFFFVKYSFSEEVKKFQMNLLFGGWGDCCLIHFEHMFLRVLLVF